MVSILNYCRQGNEMDDLTVDEYENFVSKKNGNIFIYLLILTNLFWYNAA